MACAALNWDHGRATRSGTEAAAGESTGLPASAEGGRSLACGARQASFSLDRPKDGSVLRIRPNRAPTTRTRTSLCVGRGLDRRAGGMEPKWTVSPVHWKYTRMPAPKGIFAMQTATPTPGSLTRTRVVLSGGRRLAGSSFTDVRTRARTGVPATQAGRCAHRSGLKGDQKRCQEIEALSHEGRAASD